MQNTTVLATRKDFNPFTLALKKRCEAEGEVLVRMRNSDYCKVAYRPANAEDCTGEAFHKTDHSAYWDPNGESFTSSDFDIVELVDVPAATHTKTIPIDEFRDGARDAVLKALDTYMREQTGCDNARGARDADLPQLFAGIDAHMDRVAARLNRPDSDEVGSAHLSISP
ncbi:hypothetical protein KDX16_15490 [Burkholderia vietnamiensis]|jgi:hypothetical protein|uniref:Uncharacterized protein n=2 Tax=Burkholderia cepacia complex TaxID=87882 RepID=A0A228HME0_9BURK|nr:MULTISPECIES: hypothetical protein [Burkholderia]HDR9758698.1 hypothetical protein [Burkholderia cepacia ATCC 25416]MBR7917226.1 hypothetical protein [Burkholderia vietnamiensis]MBR8054770.1 hypothetical protein [Burkholderia vietnamiensis]MDN7570560.1 hypothetical protein [Burkholderia contaminans]OXI31059.1 hypothetical protein CFB84_42415 [Burkholderia aenigmatica]